jgi:hypothetical protein
MMIGENLIHIRVNEHERDILEVITDKNVHVYKASCDLALYNHPYISEVPERVLIGQVLDVVEEGCFLIISTIGGYNTIQVNNKSDNDYSTWFEKLKVLPKTW